MDFASRSAIKPPTPPEKGSFPLDHYGDCQEHMRAYMDCLATNRGTVAACNTAATQYLSCRMDKGLMAKEELAKLGYGKNETPILVEPEKKENTGFVAGVRRTQD
eukprot:TRINITY_DN6334_c0_g1_i2.p1 TRINITY_DN6334_c0_g1~~TRINITY_DN6334_c0_g1_i2.p1  ORF type:complete len:105 (+),score=22.69 TRINITY_DN6334_c0_g1_i2:80-394(+)